MLLSIFTMHETFTLDFASVALHLAAHFERPLYSPSGSKRPAQVGIIPHIVVAEQADQGQADSNTSGCCACDDAKYEMLFTGIWSPQTHPKDFPTSMNAFFHTSCLVHRFISSSVVHPLLRHHRRNT